MDKKDSKKKNNNDFLIVQNLFNSFDPCGLIQSGAPSDEYDCLTNQILSGLYQDKSKQEIEDLIISELDHHFGIFDKPTISDIFRRDLNIFIDEIKTKINPDTNHSLK